MPSDSEMLVRALRAHRRTADQQQDMQMTQSLLGEEMMPPFGIAPGMPGGDGGAGVGSTPGGGPGMGRGRGRGMGRGRGRGGP